MPIWLVDVLLAVTLVGTSELWFRIGRRQRNTDAASQISTAQASMLGLLALMLGFSLSMAESRFDARRRIVLQEALAVGTTYLRTDFLPEPQREQSRALLRDYVHSRIDYYTAGRDAPAATARGQAIYTQVWSIAVSIAQANNTELFSSYISTLNEMIDLEAAREVALVARVPWTVHLLLVLIAIIAVGVNAYATGLSRIRVALAVTLLPMLVALACTVILDLDRSRAGFISTGNLPMERLERSMTTVTNR